MPSNVDKAFIENLQNFTDSLESIVELLKEQAEKGDSVNKMLSTMDGPKLSEISKDIKAILETSKHVDDRTKQILEEIKASRKQKEGGMFDKIEGKDNKKKIVDGIQTVILIAGGVLAIGLAFKIIGKVDFLSVISLGIGIMAVSYAFAEVAKIKDLTLAKTAMVGLTFVAMAAALTMSSYILKSFQPLTKPQMFSFVLMSTALGASAFFIFKAMDNLKIKVKDVWKYLLLPIILPAIALGLTMSSIALKNMQPISFMQGISAIFTGLALAAGAIGVAMVLKALDKNGKMNLGKIGMALLLLPGIALGLTLSSFALKGMQNISFMQGVSAIFIGLALAAGAIAVSMVVKALDKEGKMDIKKIGLALLLMPGIAAGLVISSIIFQAFLPLKNPLAVAFSSIVIAISVLAFVPTVMILGKMSLKNVAIGTLGAVMISAAIMISSWIISAGNYDNNYPSVKWAAGVGLSLLLFTPAVIVLGLLASTGVGALAIALGAAMTLVVAAAIVGTSYILGLGNYGTYPSLEWAAGVGLSLLIFTPTLVALSILGPLALLGSIFVKKIANTIVDVSNILAKGNFSSGPTNEWMTQVMGVFDIFVNKVPEKDQLKKLQNFIDVIKDFGKAANNLKGSGIDKLNKLTASVTIMSVIDDQKLQSVIRVLDNNKNTISNIIEGDGANRTETKQLTPKVEANVSAGAIKPVDKEDIMIEKFDAILGKFDELLEYVVSDQGPNNTGKGESTKRGFFR
jgi:hypothetical protein